MLLCLVDAIEYFLWYKLSVILEFIVTYKLPKPANFVLMFANVEPFFSTTSLKQITLAFVLSVKVSCRQFRIVVIAVVSEQILMRVCRLDQQLIVKL